MRRSVGILSIAVASMFAAAMAFAAEPYQHGEHTGKSGGTMSKSSGFMGEHEMSGTVTDIDKDDGRISLDSQGQKLDLHFPPSALRNVNKGDHVTVRLGIREGATGGGTSMREGTKGHATGSHGESGTGAR